MESTGALMVSGEWGCGKTYHIEIVIIPTLRQEGWNPVKVSLFGIESVNEIPLRIADNYKRAESDKGERTEKEKNKSRLCGWGKEKVGKVVAKGTQFASSISWLESFVDVKTLVGNNSGLLYKLIPTENTVIILDDIERVINTIDVHTLLGVINDLVEQRGYKVIVIANNSYMQQKGEAKLVFKEKVIEKTLVYEPYVVSIFKELCGKVYSSPFTAFMTAQKAVEVIDPSYPSYKEDKGLLVELHNIRILKFALAHFSKIYEVCNAFLKDENKDIADSFLLSLWACTVGVAIEYKKDRLTYKDRLQFAQYVELSSINWEFGDDDWKADGLFDETQEDEEQEKQKEEKQREYTNRRITYIFKKLVKVHNFPVIVSPQIFDFVTAGMSLDKEGLKAVWEGYKGLVERNSISPAYALLQKFIHSQWDMSNEEMADAVMQLAQYVEDGEFCDNMAYINSATYLQHFYPLTSFSKEDMQKKIRCGIDKMYESIDTPNLLDKLNLDVVETEIPKESRWVVRYEREKMDKITKANLDTDIKEVLRQFNEDLPTLANRLTIQYGDTKTPDFLSYPILSHIPMEYIIDKVNKIQPKEVMALYHILNGRFLEHMAAPKVYEAELTFVRNLKHALAQKNSNKTTYADILIENHLKGVIEKVNRSR
ncbi:P-loop NTPase fold protein [Hoylesella timonensis]|uniref:P-loop NTPase fold protein n=1 Tax=Hoylesella timonensis TaxID=386414 RepID=UPI001E610AA3|nr:P-loop NTPase fold protein [Hoylesella timonensis]